MKRKIRENEIANIYFVRHLETSVVFNFIKYLIFNLI